jgi:hypothetical protein
VTTNAAATTDDVAYILRIASSLYPFCHLFPWPYPPWLFRPHCAHSTAGAITNVERNFLDFSNFLIHIYSTEFQIPLVLNT